MERTEEDVASGILRIAVGGTVKAVPTLKAKYIDDWAKLLDAVTPSGIAAGNPDEGFTTIARVTNTGLLDLVAAYDRTGALGGREWLGENADPTELKAAAVQMASNAFPFGEGEGVIGMMLMTRIKQLVAPSAPLNSMKRASTNGTSTRKRSARASTRSS